MIDLATEGPVGLRVRHKGVDTDRPDEVRRATRANCDAASAEANGPKGRRRMIAR
jgi:hypothetical protein